MIIKVVKGNVRSKSPIWNHKHKPNNKPDAPAAILCLKRENCFKSQSYRVFGKNVALSFRVDTGFSVWSKANMHIQWRVASFVSSD